MVELERRQFLRGRFKPETGVIRPPYAIAESDFLALCEHCPNCALACKQNIIVMGDAGPPQMSFDRGECTFCEDCLTACQTGALDGDKARPWNIDAKISDKCLSLNAVFCRSCGDNCDETAITFKLMTGGRSTPVVDLELCIGCGGCAFVCPNKSIEILPGREKTGPGRIEGKENFNT